ncbi:WhiB family transcriptional regulator [Mycobacterium sp. URHB0021]
MSDWASLAAALAALPDLSGAKCLNRWQIFDEIDNPEITEYASHLCHSCPVLDACEAWVQGLPRNRRPRGVVGGCVYGKQDKAAA